MVWVRIPNKSPYEIVACYKWGHPDFFHPKPQWNLRPKKETQVELKSIPSVASSKCFFFVDVE